jgi:hypothetical protein
MILNKKRLSEQKKLLDCKNSCNQLFHKLIAGDSSLALNLFITITDLVEEGTSTKCDTMREK